MKWLHNVVVFDKVAALSGNDCALLRTQMFTLASLTQLKAEIQVWKWLRLGEDDNYYRPESDNSDSEGHRNENSSEPKETTGNGWPILPA